MNPELNNRQTILLIDDDREDCSFFELAVADAAPETGLRFLHTTEHLFRVVQDTAPALIFMDYQMAKENGMECLRRLKSHPVFKSIPVIMWSTSGFSDHVTAAYREGIQRYLQKPWSIRDLVKELKKIVPGHGNSFSHFAPLPKVEEYA